MPRASGDLLDWRPDLRQRDDRPVDLCAAQVAFVLQLLGAGQPLGMDRRRAQGGADRSHGTARLCQERLLALGHQMPAVGHLKRVRQGAGGGQAIGTAAVARHDLDLRLGDEPSLGRSLARVPRRSRSQIRVP